MPIAQKLFGIGKKVVQSDTGQSILKQAKRSALDAGLDIAHDVLTGQNVKQSTSKHLKQMGKSFVDNVDRELTKKRGGKKRRHGRPIKRRGGVKKKKKPRTKGRKPKRKKVKRLKKKKGRGKKKKQNRARMPRRQMSILNRWL